MNKSLKYVLLAAAASVMFVILRGHRLGSFEGLNFNTDDQSKQSPDNLTVDISGVQSDDETREPSVEDKSKESSKPLSLQKRGEPPTAPQSVSQTQVMLDGELYKWSARAGEVPVIRKIPVGGDEKNAVEWVADSLIISTKTAQSLENILAVLGSAGVRAVHSLGAAQKLWKVTISPGSIEEFFAISEKIGASDIVESRDNNFVVKTGSFSNDPLLAMQYGIGDAKTSALVRSNGGGYALGPQSADAHLKADVAWDIKRDCSAIMVGVLDSGVDSSHPDLVQNLDLDLSRNFVSDAVLADDCTQPGISIPMGASSSIVPSKFVDENGHGTHVAGTIGAIGNNSIGVSGVCWKARIITLRAMNKCGRGTSDAIFAAIDFAAQNKIQVLNMSLGGNSNSASVSQGSLAYQMIDQYANSGGLVIAAAGNSNSDNSVNPVLPASINHPALVSVASHNAINVISGYSNYSNTDVHVAAPGEAILSTVPLALDSAAASFFRENAAGLDATAKFKESAMRFPEQGYDFKDGTSMASPHVAGVAALVWSMDPSKSNLEVKNLMLETADKVPDYTSKVVSGRRINLSRAIKAAEGLSLNLSQPTGNPVFASVSSGESVYVRVNDSQARVLEGGRLYLGSSEIGACSSFDATCVGRVPLSISSGTSLELSIKSGSETLPAGSIRVIGLSVSNGLFAPNEARFSCRVSADRNTIASFKAASFDACKNLCRMLVPAHLSGLGQCSFGDLTESIQSEACRASN